MKIIFKIAKTELQKLFYSPVAWLILIIFCFQTADGFSAIFSGYVKAKQMGYPTNNITNSVFSDILGIYPSALKYLYLYIPLLTMGIMSQEFSTGSIKLLYSSPITNRQIIVGKYLALAIFGLVMVGIISVFTIYGSIAIEHADVKLMLCGLLGIYLVICTYSAIGLFVSSLTSYIVVAGIGTLGVLAALTYLSSLGQDLPIIRDVTYWLGISGRAESFIRGMITSEDIVYFLTVIVAFLAFTICNLHHGRQKIKLTNRILQYFLISICAIFIGFLTSQPRFKSYLDVTNTQANTLTKSSRDVVSKLSDDVNITTYVNMLEPYNYLGLPSAYKQEQNRFKDYLRFRPEIKLKYVYYYHNTKNEFLDKQYPNLSEKQRFDTLSKLQNWDFKVVPYNEIASKVDLSPEGFRFVRVIESKGRQVFLRTFEDSQRIPTEQEITAAIKKLVMKLPLVGFVAGQGEREFGSKRENGYNLFTAEKTFRYAMINQGLDFVQLGLDKPVPPGIRILVIAAMKRPFSAAEQTNLKKYISAGGNMFILGEPGSESYMNPITENLGVRFLPGVLVKPSETLPINLTIATPTAKSSSFAPDLKILLQNGLAVSMPTASALELSKPAGFRATTWFTSGSPEGWNERNSDYQNLDSAQFDSRAGEVKQSYPAVIALSRNVNHREQKIIVTGDADWLSNGELGQTRAVKTANYQLITGSFYWLSDGEVPIDMYRTPPKDNNVKTTSSAWSVISNIFKWVMPLSLLIIALLIWLRRRGK